MRLAQCGHLPRRPLQGNWIRVVHPKYLANPLSTAHTAAHATRFNPGTTPDPSFQILYLAEDLTTGLFEVQALLGSPYPGAVSVPSPAGGGWVGIDVKVDLQAVVDFTRYAPRYLVQTSVQELTGDWRGYWLRSPARPRGGMHGSDVPTQLLGRRLERVRGAEGFISFSSRVGTRRILMVFPHKLMSGSRLTYRDPLSGTTRTLP
jgi:hypothetical protein